MVVKATYMLFHFALTVIEWSQLSLSLFTNGQSKAQKRINQTNAHSNYCIRKTNFMIKMVKGYQFSSVQFSSVQLLSHVWLFATPWIAACQASLSITNSWSLLKLMSIESVMPTSHFILCRPLLLLLPIPPSISFQWVNSLHEVAKVLEFQLQHLSFQWTPRTDLL